MSVTSLNSGETPALERFSKLFMVTEDHFPGIGREINLPENMLICAGKTRDHAHTSVLILENKTGDASAGLRLGNPGMKPASVLHNSALQLRTTFNILSGLWVSVFELLSYLQKFLNKALKCLVMMSFRPAC